MSSTELILFGVIVALLIVLVSVTVLFLRALSNVYLFADSVHVRAQSSVDRLLDRVMAGDFAIFKAQQSVELADEGGWEPPDEEEVPEDIQQALDEGHRFSLTGMRLPKEE